MSEAIKYWKAFDRNRRKYERRVINNFRKSLNAQIKPVLARILITKDPEEVISQISMLVKDDSIRDEMIRTYQIVGVDFAKREYSQIVKSDYRDFLTKDQAEDLEDTWMLHMKEFALTKAGERITLITGTTRQQAIREIRKGLKITIEEGLGIDESAEIIEELVRSKWREVSRYRAARIARTEIISASNEGSFKGARDTGLNMNKLWIATPTGETRPAHMQAGDLYGKGYGIPMEEAFNVDGERLMYPGDPAGSAGNVINCRCAIGYEETKI